MRIALLAAAMSANTRSWVAGLTSHGHHVDVVTFHPGDVPGATVHVVPTPRAIGKLGYVLAAPRIKRLLRELSPDLTIGYYLSSYGLVSALAWRGPLVLTAAGSDILMPRSNRLVRYLGRRGDLFVAWADHMAARLETLGIPPAKILKVARGIDTTVFTSEGERLAPAASRQLVVSTRNFRPIYSLDVIVKAVARVISAGVDVEYRLLGRGPLQDDLEALSRDLGIADRVAFVGHHPPATIAAHLRSAAVYAAASRSDGASASLFEAMACGAFPVVSDIPANAEWIEHGTNGFLASSDDPIAFAEMLKEALNRPDLRSRAARCNADIVKAKLDRRTNIEVMTKRFEEVTSCRPPN
jgi:glycosyltransferase involved in cell wall biosynthesis